MNYNNLNQYKFTIDIHTKIIYLHFLISKNKMYISKYFLLIACFFTSQFLLAQKYCTVIKDHKGDWRIVDEKGETYFKPSFEIDHVFPPKSDYFILRSDANIYHYFNPKTKECSPQSLEHLRDISEGLAFYKLDGKWGYIDFYLKTAITPKYDDVTLFKNGVAWVKKDKLWYLIDKKGVELTQKGYKSYEEFIDGFAKVKTKTGLGMINLHGEEILKCIYKEITDVKENLICVKKDSLWGVMKTNGETIHEPKYHYFHSLFEKGINIFWENEKLGVMDCNGKIIVPPTYKRIKGTNLKGYSFAHKGFGWDLIDNTGNIIESNIERWHDYSDGYFLAQIDGIWGYLSPTAEFKKMSQLYSIKGFSEGLAPVKFGELWGYINKNLDLVIDYQFIHCTPFVGGYAQVLKPKGNWGYIDYEGKERTPFEYKETQPFVLNKENPLDFQVSKIPYSDQHYKSFSTTDTSQNKAFVTIIKNTTGICIIDRNGIELDNYINDIFNTKGDFWKYNYKFTYGWTMIDIKTGQIMFKDSKVIYDMVEIPE